MPTAASICVVVMSTDSDVRTAEAVDSILGQSTPAEVAVVNTGAGTLEGTLAAFLDRLTLVETPVRRFAGGNRNLGIQYTRAPIVSFLASDCTITDGWLERRILAHRDCLAVGSAVRPAAESTAWRAMIAWASYASTHFSRMPEIDARAAGRFGASYDRDVFVRLGGFDDSLRIGEDTEFNRRAQRLGTIAWDPKIITLHRYPATLRSAIADQVARGKRVARHAAAVGEGPRSGCATIEARRTVRDYLKLARDDRGRFHPRVVGARWLALGLGLVRAASALYFAMVTPRRGVRGVDGRAV